MTDRAISFLALGLAAALALGHAVPAFAFPFARADLNGDGLVTPAEAHRSMDRMAEVHVLKCDRNGDGVIERSEFACLSGRYDALYRDRNR